MSNQGTPTNPDGGFEAPAEARFAIVAARFNGHIVDRLLAGALQGFARNDVGEERVAVVRVPGAFELPLACKVLCDSGRYAAVVALGAVVRGDTPHFDYVAGEAARGCARVQLDSGVPVIFGVLTTDDDRQALARAGDGGGANKGQAAADAALEMAALLHGLARDGARG